MPSGYFSYNVPIFSVSNQNDDRSAPRQTKILREQNQKDATATTQKPISIRNIPLFR